MCQRLVVYMNQLVMCVYRLCFWPVFSFVSLPLTAQIQVAGTRMDCAPAKALVSFQLRNEFAAPLQQAKAWIFLLDAQGQVVGEHSDWIVGGRGTAGPQAAQSDAAYALPVPLRGAPISAVVTLTQATLADGTVVRPQVQVRQVPELAPRPAPPPPPKAKEGKD